MTTPHWQFLHEGWEDDFEFWVRQRYDVVLLLRKHPDDDLGKSFREILSCIDKKIEVLQKEYKKIYGTRYNIRRINNFES